MVVWIHTGAEVVDIVQVMRTNLCRDVAQRGGACCGRVRPATLKFLTKADATRGISTALYANGLF